MEFYRSEATILTESKPISILLQKIHKTHIAWHQRSIFALLCQMSIVQDDLSMDTYIASFPFNNRLLSFVIQQSKAWCYYCYIIFYYFDIRYHATTIIRFLSNNSTIWYHNSTVWHHNRSTIESILKNVDCVIWYNE